MRISVITPSYNQAAFIERTVLSVLNQNYPDFEYIIMDGGSDDGTVEILKKYSDKIIWKSEKDSGQSDAINKGLHLATGDIVAYLNSDDTYEPETLKKVADFFAENPEKKWALGKCRIINEKDQGIRKLITFYKNLFLKRYSYGKLLAENFICQPAVFWRKELLGKIGYFNENEHFCMDYEYWLRIGKIYEPGFIDEYLSNFRYYSTSKSGKVGSEMLQDELRIAKTYAARAKFWIFLHRLNFYKIRLTYRIINFFGA